MDDRPLAGGKSVKRFLFLVGAASFAVTAHAQEVVLPVPPPPPGVTVSVHEPPPPEVTVAVPVPPPPATIAVVPPGPPTVRGSASVEGSLELGDVHLRAAFELLFGFTRMDPAVDGSSFGLGLSLEWAPLEWLALGVRGGWSTTPDVGLDLDRDGRDDVEERGTPNLVTFTAGPRLRIPTAPRGQDGFSIELGGGYGLVVDGLRPSGALLELALSRWGDAGGAGGGPVLRLQQGLGDAGSLTTVLVGVQGGIDTDGRSVGGQSEFRYVLGWDASLGGGFLEQGLVATGFAAQLGMAFGVPLGDVVEPRLRLDFGHRVAGEERDGLETYGLSGGVRLLLDPWVPLYVEAAGGWAFRFGTRAADVPGGAFLDVGAGARFIDCEGSRVAVVLGARARIGLFADDALTALYGVLGIEYDALPPTDRPRCRGRVLTLRGATRPDAAEPQAEPSPPVDASPPVEATYSTPVEPAEVEPSLPIAPNEPEPIDREGCPPPLFGAPPAVEGPASTASSTASAPSRVPLRFALQPLFGLMDADLSAEGPIAGFAGSFGVGFDANWGFDLRLGALGGPDALEQDPVRLDHVDAIGTPGPLLLSVGAGPRLVVWSDEDSRIGWGFELTGSYAYLEGSRPGSTDPGARWGRHGGLLEFGLGPQRGHRGGGGFAFDVQLELRLQQGLGDLIEYRALLLGLRFAFEADTPPPAGAPDRDADFQYTFGGQLSYGIAPGADRARNVPWLMGVGRATMHFGLPIGRWLEVRAVGGLGPRSVADNEVLWILDVVGAARMRWDEVFPLYVQAGAGYAFQYGASASQAPAGAVLDVGIGARFTDCTGRSDGALEIGLALRLGLEQDRTNDALLLTFGYEYAGGRPMFGQDERWHCRARASSARPAPRRTPPSDVEVDASVSPAPPPAPPTPASPPAPRTFEVVLGFAVPGLAVHVDPALLPLAEMLGAGRVEIEIVGPASALLEVEGELRAVIGARGARLDAVTHVVVGDPTVRARITVYPPR